MDDVLEKFLREKIAREERDAVPGQVPCPVDHAANGTSREVPEFREGCPACGAIA